MLGALALLSLTALAVLHLFLVGLGLVGRAQAGTQAVAWVQAELEYLRGVPVQELASHEVTSGRGPCLSTEPCLPPGFARGVVVVRRPTVDGIELPGVREVSVAVYRTRQTRAPDYSAVTWIADRRWPAQP